MPPKLKRQTWEHQNKQYNRIKHTELIKMFIEEKWGIDAPGTVYTPYNHMRVAELQTCLLEDCGDPAITGLKTKSDYVRAVSFINIHPDELGHHTIVRTPLPPCLPTQIKIQLTNCSCTPDRLYRLKEVVVDLDVTECAICKSAVLGNPHGKPGALVHAEGFYVVWVPSPHV